jgi:hypothetical protein
VNSHPSDEDEAGLGALERVLDLARRGQAAYRQQTTALGRWLRAHLSSQPGDEGQLRADHSLRRLFAARHLRERQQLYRKAGGEQSGASEYVQQRLDKLRERED